jgi:EAL domain-containing protein (putative c-di-GMP-specific phosphodiesterase class I)
VQIAHAHGLSIVAEGIEDAATLAAVEELGCDYAQGFHVAMPMAADQITALLSAATHPAPLYLVTDLTAGR